MKVVKISEEAYEALKQLQQIFHNKVGTKLTMKQVAEKCIIDRWREESKK